VQEAVVAALARVNEQVRSVQALDVTVGDEFQGAYGSVADALLAALLVRLELLPDVDTRYGLGWGPYEVFDSNRSILSQDGPGWWAAREAIDRVKAESAHPRSKHLRTWFVAQTADPSRTGEVTFHASGSPDSLLAPAVNAFLLCRDESIGRMSERGTSLLLGLMYGRSQAEMAEAEDITQPAVSQHLSRNGAFAIHHAHAILNGAFT
jgi:hypothetical protein